MCIIVQLVSFLKRYEIFLKASKWTLTSDYGAVVSANVFLSIYTWKKARTSCNFAILEKKHLRTARENLTIVFIRGSWRGLRGQSLISTEKKNRHATTARLIKFIKSLRNGKKVAIRIYSSRLMTCNLDHSNYLLTILDTVIFSSRLCAGMNTS